MIRTLINIPKECYVAVSGGPDSMAVLDFLRLSKRNLGALYVDHRTGASDVSEKVVHNYCTRYDIPLEVYQLPPIGELQEKHNNSPEACWHEERKAFFHSMDRPVITGHNLDDACEWWLFTSFNGIPHLMPAANKNILRPFLLTKKNILKGWCDDKGVPYAIDPSNVSYKHSRNRIRHEILPQVLKIQPGFRKVISKKLIKEYRV